MRTTDYETDRAIALALDQRRQSEEDAQGQQFFDESLARTLQDEEIAHTGTGDDLRSQFSAMASLDASALCTILHTA